MRMYIRKAIAPGETPVYQICMVVNDCLFISDWTFDEMTKAEERMRQIQASLEHVQ